MTRHLIRAATIAAGAVMVTFTASCSANDTSAPAVTTIATANATSNTRPDTNTSTPVPTSTVETATVAGSDFAPTGEVVTFPDPEGHYTINIGGWWQRNIAPGIIPEEMEAWTIGELVDGYSANVNMITFDSRGWDIDTFLTKSLDNMADFTAVDSGTVVTNDGETLGYLEYTEQVNDLALHYLAYVSIGATNANLVTLTASEASFGEQRELTEPLMLTLRSTDS